MGFEELFSGITIASDHDFGKKEFFFSFFGIRHQILSSNISEMWVDLCRDRKLLSFLDAEVNLQCIKWVLIAKKENKMLIITSLGPRRRIQEANGARL